MADPVITTVSVTRTIVTVIATKSSAKVKPLVAEDELEVFFIE
jgi:hypothetical protein